jgi:hypothetical protein
MVNILGGHSIGHSKQKNVYVLYCTRVLLRTVSAISLYICKIEGILRTVSNASIYGSRDKVGTVYLVQYIFENSTINIHVPCNSWGHGVLLVWVHLDFPLCERQPPLCDQAVRLVYPLYFCTLHSSLNSINKHLTGLGLDIWVATTDPPIKQYHWDVALQVGYNVLGPRHADST